MTKAKQHIPQKQEEKKTGKFKSLQKAIHTYWKMNTEEKQLIRKRMIDGAHTVDQWLALAEQGAEFDHYADAVRPYLGKRSTMILVCAFFALILGAAFGLSEPEFYPIFYFGATIGGLLFLVGMIFYGFYFYLKSQDIPNHLRLFVVPLLRVLKEEVGDLALVHIKSDLRKKARKDNEIHREKNYKDTFINRFGWLIVPGVIALYIFALSFGVSRIIFFPAIAFLVFVFVITFSSFLGKYPRIVTTKHEYPWLALSTHLIDGSKLIVNIQDDVTRYKISKRKRSRSAKTKVKTKTKYKVRTNFWITLNLPNKRYGVEEGITTSARNAQGVKMKHKVGEKRNTLKVNFRWKTKDIHAVPDFQQFLGLIAKAYKKSKPVEE